MVQPKSTAIICGGRELVNKDGLESDKKITSEELSKLIASDLWKKEKEEKKKEWAITSKI